MRTMEFRGDVASEAENILQLRDLIRGRKHRLMPDGPAGFVAEDLDLVLRWFGPTSLYPNLDATGRVRLVELKRRGGRLETSKAMTFGMLHRRLCGWDRYDGWYLVHHSDDNHDENTTYWVNGVAMSCNKFLDWVQEPFSPVPGMWTDAASTGGDA